MRSIHVENGRIVPSEFRGKGFFGSLVHDTSTLSRNLAKNRLQRHLDDYFYIIKCQIAYVNKMIKVYHKLVSLCFYLQPLHSK